MIPANIWRRYVSMQPVRGGRMGRESVWVQCYLADLFSVVFHLKVFPLEGNGQI